MADSTGTSSYHINDEYLFSIDKFKKPVHITSKTYNAFLLIIRLILMNPGTIQSNPEMGVGLVSRYRYGYPSDIAQLAVDINNQIATYLPTFSFINVAVSIDAGNSHVVNIELNARQEVLTFSYDLELKDLV